tara:strand:+ start:31 stop:147 length:117 start_codon:yes stop_codon:yes gene_type:complete
MIGLFFIGMPLTIIGLFIAYYIASKEKKQEKEWKWYET